MEDLKGFSEKDSLEVAIWLKSNGISQEICDCFEGKVASKVVSLHSAVFRLHTIELLRTLFPG